MSRDKLHQLLQDIRGSLFLSFFLSFFFSFCPSTDEVQRLNNDFHRLNLQQNSMSVLNKALTETTAHSWRNAVFLLTCDMMKSDNSAQTAKSFGQCPVSACQRAAVCVSLCFSLCVASVSASLTASWRTAEPANQSAGAGRVTAWAGFQTGVRYKRIHK